jgi:hypothetical protein
MLPAHVTREQAVSFGRALLKRHPEVDRILTQSVKGVMAGRFPRESAEFKRR